MPGQPTRGWPSASAATESDAEGTRTHRQRSTWAQLRTVLRRHWLFVGPGMLSATGYIDPGNWAAGLSSGSLTGYTLLSVVWIASLCAVVLQVLSARLGIVTGMDLAQASRAYLLTGRADRQAKRESEQSTQVIRSQTHFTSLEWTLRVGALWSLYLIAELAIMATELAEIMGSAIALTLLFPWISLWAGVLLTSLDVLGVLLLYRPEHGPPRVFEALISILVFVVLGCFMLLTARVGPVWSDVLKGFVPSKVLLEPRPIFLGVSILGATVMPHALFLGSHIGTINRLSEQDLEPKPLFVSTSLSDSESEEQPAQPTHPETTNSAVASGPDADQPEESHVVPWNLPVVRLHLQHATFDIVGSLLGFALGINALILIVAAAAFYHSPSDGNQVGEVGDLFDAYHLLRTYLGPSSATLFAVALLASAQCSSITVTLAGQIISEGFVRWNVGPMQRRIITRLLAIVPTFVVAASVGRSGLNEMLLISQVLLSMVLPFVTLPLLLLTSYKAAMRIWDYTTKPSVPHASEAAESIEAESNSVGERTPLVSQPQESWVSFVNPRWLEVVAWITFVTIVIADGFVLVTGG